MSDSATATGSGSTFENQLASRDSLWLALHFTRHTSHPSPATAAVVITGGNAAAAGANVTLGA